MKKVLNYIGIGPIGLLEFILAMYPILGGYQYGHIPFSLLVLIILDVIVLVKTQGKPKKRQPNKAVKYLILYVMVHETVLFFTLPSIPSYFVNSYIGQIIIFTSILIIGPNLNFNKFLSSISIVAIICMLGLLYQLPIILSGGVTTPLSLPFMPALDAEARAYEELTRPSSFFWEPQSYCSYMFVLLFFALKEKKMVWAAIITISMFLTGSTTGIVISVFMFAYTAFFTGGQKVSNRIIILIVAVGLVYLLLNSSFFDAGVSKMESTSYERNSRLYNGISLVLRMPMSDLIIGGNAATVADYYFSGAAGTGFLIEKNGTVYVSTFWTIIVKFGIIGLFIYLWTYIKPIMQAKELAIYVMALVIMLFTNPDDISGMYAYEMLVINCYLIHRKNEGIYNYNALRK